MNVMHSESIMVSARTGELPDQPGLSLPTIDEFSAGVNVVICLMVASWALYWRRQRLAVDHQCRYRAYCAWSLAWLAWLAAWLLLFFSLFV
jgi:hypothetical protein